MTPGDPLKEAVRAASMDIASAGADETLELFDLPCADPTGEIETARRVGLKGGRPKGAQNIATRELREYLLKRGMLPQQALMQWFMLGPHGIAKALGVGLAEAFGRWSDLGDKLGKYFMAPMAAVDQAGKAVPNIAVFIAGQQGVVAEDGTQLPPWAYLDQQNQTLNTIEGEPSKVEGE